jgi:osmotically-inducible protein OsmY
MNITAEDLEARIEAESGINTIVEQDGENLVLSGMVETEGEHQAVLDVARSLVDDESHLVDNIEVTTVLADVLDGMEIESSIGADMATSTPDTEDYESLEPGDFMDQAILGNAKGAAGPSDIADIDQDYSEGEEVYVPPTDPPSDGANEVIGGFQTTSMDPESVDRSEVIGGPADEAIREAVLRELRQDSETTALEIEVNVFEGVVVLRGTVDDILDVESAEDIAGRVPGVREVQEKLKLRNA